MSFVALALAASAAAYPQASSASDCQDSKDGNFVISVVNITDPSAKRSLERRQLDGTLTLSLAGGVLKDQAGRDGYIAANHQFQFDQPVQEGALESSGFEVCSNGTLALSGSAIWYQCYSGGFYNLYDESQGEQCNPIYIYAADSDSTSTATGAVSQATDGQPIASTQGPAVSQIPDGQPQAPTSQGAAPVISQISYGQPQVPTGAPVISQISDGQPQVPTGAPMISQISDGQSQVPTGAPVVTQISEGQIQVPTATPAPTVVGPIISQISDGQPQVPAPTASYIPGNYTSPNATGGPAPEFPGTAMTPLVASGALAAGIMAMFALL